MTQHAGAGGQQPDQPIFYREDGKNLAARIADRFEDADLVAAVEHRQADRVGHQQHACQQRQPGHRHRQDEQVAGSCA